MTKKRIEAFFQTGPSSCELYVFSSSERLHLWLPPVPSQHRPTHFPSAFRAFLGVRGSHQDGESKSCLGIVVLPCCITNLADGSFLYYRRTCTRKTLRRRRLVRLNPLWVVWPYAHLRSHDYESLDLPVLLIQPVGISKISKTLKSCHFC